MYRDVDALLDAFPWSGHATTCESLWMGVPVVALRGDRHAGRMSASILSCVGLREWVTSTADQYVKIAVEAAARPQSLASLRAGLRDRMRTSPLCDHAGFVHRLDAAYRGIWHGVTAGAR